MEKKIEERNEKISLISCNDKKCPFHSKISVRGRTFRGYVLKKFQTRVVIEFERTVYIRKYERYMKKKTKIHAHLPLCLSNEINLRDYVEVRECMPLSKIIHFMIIKKIRSAEELKLKK